MAVAAILAAIAIPQMVSQRRLMRSTAVTREIMAQMRYTRQLAMSKRQAYTFQYDDNTKQINIIGPIPPGTAALTDANYPNNVGSAVVLTIPLTQSGLLRGEISSGIPAGLPGSPTSADGITGTNLNGARLNITFQPDASVIDNTGFPVDNALFIYNNKAARATASAITVRGASGRVKIWRYVTNANANSSSYAE
jgi:Tfp pilus assembly protein FimT